MKWIKASERVPDHYRLVHLQYNNADKIFSKATARYNPSMGHWLAVNGFELKGCTDLEWLDESPPASAVEEAEKLYPDDPNDGFKAQQEIYRLRNAHITCAGIYTGEISRLKTLIKDLYESEVAEPCRNAGAADDLIESHWQEFKVKHNL